MTFKEFPHQVDVDGLCDARHPSVRYIGKATLQENGKFICLADMLGMLCVVEVNLRSIPGADPETAGSIGL